MQLYNVGDAGKDSKVQLLLMNFDYHMHYTVYIIRIK